MLNSVPAPTVLLTVLATGHPLPTGGQPSLAELAKILGTPMPSTTVTALDIETAEVPLPPLARPTSQLLR